MEFTTVNLYYIRLLQVVKLTNRSKLNKQTQIRPFPKKSMSKIFRG